MPRRGRAPWPAGGGDRAWRRRSCPDGRSAGSVERRPGALAGMNLDELAAMEDPHEAAVGPHLDPGARSGCRGPSRGPSPPRCGGRDGRWPSHRSAGRRTASAPGTALAGPRRRRPRPVGPASCRAHAGRRAQSTSARLAAGRRGRSRKLSPAKNECRTNGTARSTLGTSQRGGAGSRQSPTTRRNRQRGHPVSLSTVSRYRKPARRASHPARGTANPSTISTPVTIPPALTRPRITALTMVVRHDAHSWDPTRCPDVGSGSLLPVSQPPRSNGDADSWSCCDACAR